MGDFFVGYCLNFSQFVVHLGIRKRAIKQNSVYYARHFLRNTPKNHSRSDARIHCKQLLGLSHFYLRNLPQPMNSHPKPGSFNAQRQTKRDLSDRFVANF